MSGISKSIKKSFKRLSKSKVAKGVLIGLAAYYVGGLASGAMGNADAASGAQSWSAGDAIDMGADVPVDTSTSWAAGDAIDAGDDNPSWAAGDAIDAGGDALFDTPTSEVTAGLKTPGQTTTPQSSQAPGSEVPKSVPSWGMNASGSAGVGAEARGGINVKPPGWFGGLSPNAQAIIAGSMFGGAGQVIKALAAKSAQEDQAKREQRARDDKIRRGLIAPYGTNAFTSRGIIGSAFTPKPGGGG